MNPGRASVLRLEHLLLPWIPGVALLDRCRSWHPQDDAHSAGRGLSGDADQLVELVLRGLAVAGNAKVEGVHTSILAFAASTQKAVLCGPSTRHPWHMLRPHS